MRQPRIEGIVEFVTSGARLKVFVPKDHCLCAVLLGKLMFLLIVYFYRIAKYIIDC